MIAVVKNKGRKGSDLNPLNNRHRLNNAANDHKSDDRVTPLEHSTTTTSTSTKAIKGRGSSQNYAHRFLKHQLIPSSESLLEEFSKPLHTEWIEETSKSIISYNQSPDVPFDRSINPYRGCEHGCIYCFARPSHAYWDLNPGLDFETKIVYKTNAVEKLEQELSKPNYQCQPIALGVNTDAYQPIEQQLEITRELLKVLLKYKHPVSILTKSKLILRDLDLLDALNQYGLVSVGVSITTLNNRLKSLMEPRAASANARLNVMETLVQHNIPTRAMIAPIIPAINDGEIEAIVKRISDAGVKQASYIMLRLPWELKQIFTDWLEQHFPYKKNKVLNFLTDIRSGSLNQSAFGKRMTGDGVFAQLFKSRFQVACRRYGVNQVKEQKLNTDFFDNGQPQQLSLL
jgi:DNA repair photolyase